MEAGTQIYFERPWWGGARTLLNERGAPIGLFRMRSPLSFRKAEGELSGKTLHFVYSGIHPRQTEVKDEWGHVVGTMHRSGWLGRESQLIVYEKEYRWRSSALGDRFWIETTDGTALIEVVGCGGFGTKGVANIQQSLSHEEILALVYMGLFQMRLFEVEVAATTAIIAGTLAIFFS